MTYKIDGKEYEVVIERKQNKNLYIRVKEDMKIHVSCNQLTTKRYIKHLLSENEIAIKHMIEKQEINRQREKDFYCFGRKYDIIIVPTLDEVTWGETAVYVPDKEKFKRQMEKEWKRVFQQHFDQIYEQFHEDVSYPKMKIRKMKTRWGVYNRRNHSVTLNANLSMYPMECLDYVIVHELSHIVHFDHSREFWNLVSKYCPEYKRIKNILKG